jgi:hypothetical protein
MKKVTGIISLIVCCIGIVLSFGKMHNIYLEILSIKENEKYIIDLKKKQKETEQELQTKINELMKIHTEKERIDKLLTMEWEQAGYASERYQKLLREKNTIALEERRLNRSIAYIEGDNLPIYMDDGSIKGIRRKIAYFQTSIKSTREEAPNAILMTLLFISTQALGVYYIIATGFGSANSTVIKHLIKENNFIRKQVERNELLVKLKNTEKG